MAALGGVTFDVIYKKIMLLIFSYYECHLAIFRTICDQLQTSYGLLPTLNVSIKEGLVIFQWICDDNEVQRNVRLGFGRTQETVKRKFVAVLTSTDLFACDYIKTPTRKESHKFSNDYI